MLKLARIPDRTPVKMTIPCRPTSTRRSTDYAAAYQEAYGASAAGGRARAGHARLVHRERPGVRAARGRRGREGRNDGAG